MNILFHRYNSICEPDFIEAFGALGIEVIEDRDADCSQAETSATGGNEATVGTDAQIGSGTSGESALQKKMLRLGEAIIKNRPVFVFTINFFPYISMVCEKVRVRYVCVSVDCPVTELFSKQIRNSCNYVFLFDYRQYQDIAGENPGHIFYMPLGVNAARLDTMMGQPDWDLLSQPEKNKKAYNYDVSFIGSLYNEKNPFPDMYGKLPMKYKGMADAYIAAQKLLPGQDLLEASVAEDMAAAVKKAEPDNFYSDDMSVCNLDRFITINDYMAPELTVSDRLELLESIGQSLEEKGKLHIFTKSAIPDRLKSLDVSGQIKLHGGVSSLEEMPRVFRTSRINLNPTMRSIRSGLPQRIWDICGAGGFLLTNYQAELPEYFEIGKHLAAYETPAEACELIRYYLEHEDERLEVAQAGYELAKAKHTVLNRVLEIIRTIDMSSQTDVGEQ